MIRAVTLAITLIFVVASVSAGDIILKKTFFAGWKYSTDGATYQRVGILGKGLRAEMAGNESAQANMKRYAQYKVWSLVTGIPGGMMLAYSLAKRMDEDKWEEPYRTMYLTSLPLCISAVIMDEMATSRLQRAVRIYNGQEKSSYLPSPGIYAAGDGALGLNLTWRF